jgi:hypothetical protein
MTSAEAFARCIELCRERVKEHKRSQGISLITTEHYDALTVRIEELQTLIALLTAEASVHR